MMTIDVRKMAEFWDFGHTMLYKIKGLIAGREVPRWALFGRLFLKEE